MPTTFRFEVTVTTDTYAHAAMVMEERIAFDERYFVTPDDEPTGRQAAGPDDTELAYAIDWDPTPLTDLTEDLS